MREPADSPAGELRPAPTSPTTAEQISSLNSTRQHDRMLAASVTAIDRYRKALQGNPSPEHQAALTREILRIRRRRDTATAEDSRAVQAAFWDFTAAEGLALPEVTAAVAITPVDVLTQPPADLRAFPLAGPGFRAGTELSAIGDLPEPSPLA